jgi:hypothetical protein
MNFNSVFTDYHGLLFEAPGGVITGEGAPISFHHWESEEHGLYATGGMITVDTGTLNGTPGTYPSPNIPGLLLEQLDNADASNKILLQYKGQNAGGTVALDLIGSDTFNPLVACAATSTTCSMGVSPTITSDSAQNLNGSLKNYVGFGSGGDNYYLLRPFVVSGGYGNMGATPPNPVFADALPPPYQISISSTGSGSLAAGQYCMMVVGLDGQSTAGTTLPSSEICQTVSASSDIVLSWNVPQYGQAYKDFYLYYGTGGPGSENMYLDTGNSPSNTTTFGYTFTSTAGAVSSSVPKLPTAYTTWIYRDANKPSCLLCVPGTQSYWQLGVGEPSPPAGDKLAVKGGVLDAEAGFKSALSTKSANYTLTTSDYWVNVTGTATITVPHASTGNLWVVFNSGSSTVTVQADSGNVNGAASITVAANTGKEIACDGTNCFAH